MSRFFKPTKFIGFDLDSVESWDFHPAKPDERFMEKACLEITFKSGKTRKLYGDIAENVNKVLENSSLDLFME